MFCPSCKHENRADRKFCVHCGAGLELTCRSCGASAQPGERFCGECGKPLGATAKEATPREPRSYTPKHLAEKILTSRSALEGERKQVTVLFADVKGSMELAEQVDPEEWHQILRTLLPDPHRRRRIASRGRSTSTLATESWRCSARRSHTRIMPSARVWPPSICATPCVPTPTSCVVPMR